MTPASKKFVVKSSDVLSDMRVNVFEEGSESAVVWYKERFLSDDEIVEHVFDNANSTICWTIHKPKRGWYIRIRAPTFPPGMFIPILPLPKASPYYVDGGLSFSCRTNVPIPMSIPRSPPQAKISIDSNASLADVPSSSSSPTNNIVHSYPPTPPRIIVHVQPPSPRSVHAKLDQLKKPMRITKFVLTPNLTPQQAVVNSSLFSRVFSVLKSNVPSSDYSFTLSPAPASSTPREYCVQTPLLTFYDRTPMMTVRSTTGVLEINDVEERMMGVAPSFWIAVALTYLEFLGDRESYLAASTD